MIDAMSQHSFDLDALEPVVPFGQVTVSGSESRVVWQVREEAYTRLGFYLVPGTG